MTIKISISSESEAILRRLAEQEQRSVEAMAAEIMERSLRTPSLDEILAPIRAEFEKSGMTDEQLSEALERAKHDQRSQRGMRRAS